MKLKSVWRAGVVVLAFSANWSHVFGETTLLNETFESYADTAAMQAVWVGTDPNVSRIADNSNNPNAFPAAGQGVEHLGGAVNVWSGLNAGNALHPTPTQSIRIEADIYNDAASGNKRVSLGLRGSAVNILELGAWNANTCDPTVSGCVPGTTAAGGPGFIGADGRALAARMQLFGGITAPLVVQPNWQYFNLPLELDTSANGVVSVSEVGAAWSHYVATIAPSAITISIDLFNDGVRNVSKTPGDGTPGVDATATWNVTTTAAGYSDLRFGGPSGVASAGGSLIFDNIKLTLIDVTPPGVPGDYNGNGVVDAADYVLWRDGGPLQNEVDTPGTVNAADYDAWRARFGNQSGSGSSLVGAAVPEPATFALLAVSVAALLATRKSR